MISGWNEEGDGARFHGPDTSRRERWTEPGRRPHPWHRARSLPWSAVEAGRPTWTEIPQACPRVVGNAEVLATTWSLSIGLADALRGAQVMLATWRRDLETSRVDVEGGTVAEEATDRPRSLDQGVAGDTRNGSAYDLEPEPSPVPAAADVGIEERQEVPPRWRQAS